MAMSSAETIGASVRVFDFPPEPECMLPPIQGFEEKPLVSLEKAVEPLIDIVPQLDHMVWTVKQSCRQPEDDLSLDESGSIMLYTLEWMPQEKSFYFILNATLRSQNRRELVPWFLYLRLLIFALSKLPSIRPQIIFRGVAKDMRDEFPVGKIFIWWSFTSCTSSLSVLENYLSKTGKRTIFNILCNAAKDISRHSSYRTEKELILYPARQFEVMSSFDGGNDLQIFQLEETHPPFPLIPIAQASTNTITNILQSSNPAPPETFSSSSTTTTDTSVCIITRQAVDSSGRIGSLYDGYRDCILGHLNVKEAEKLYQPYGNVRCDITHSNNDRTQNLFRLLGIDEQLRLSILLQLAPMTGIASLIDYSYTTKEHTRLLRYTYVHQIQQLPDTIEDARAFIQALTSDTKATHIITRVEWGIDFIIILELPYDKQAAAAIDRVLENICSLLRSDSSSLTLMSTEENILKEILHTKVYSNIPVDDVYHMKTLRDVCQYIEQSIYSNVYHPVLYNLRPIKWLNPYYTGKSVTFIPLPKNLNENIEEYVLQLRKTMKKRETSIYKNVPKLLCGHLNERLSDLQKQWSDVKKIYTNEIEFLSKLVIDIRSEQVQIPTIAEALKKNEQTSMTNTMDNLIQYLNDLKEKGKLITSLIEQKFTYCDVTDHSIDRLDNEILIERKLILNDQQDCVLCSNDTLNKIKPTKLKNLRREMVEEFQNNSNLRLIYVDFSYCSFELQNMMKLPSSRYRKEQNKQKQKKTTPFRKLKTINSSSIKAQTSFPPSTETQISTLTTTMVKITDPLFIKAQTCASAFTKVQTYISPFTEMPTSRSPSTSLSDNETINILLLGHTGVGKSTFINALANYLTFDTLQQAETGQPVVIIPVSFLIIAGDKFDEHIVKFGDEDGLKNEDFNDRGQSVTRHCKSYIFHLPHHGGQKLRIIDTPGYGDKRGIHHDDRNMQHILEYISNLTHINAVCFLLKPVKSRLNISFRSCVTQILSTFGQNIAENIIFCFINSRPTVNTPENTVPLLKKMLASLLKNDVAFKNENVFYFDNESFRYLVALQNGIDFNDLEKSEYEKSWSTSIIQSNHFINYIQIKLPAYCMNGNLQSTKHAQLEIVHMIRPILETMRNILRNRIIHTMIHSNGSFELHPKTISRPASICTSCSPYPLHVDKLWVAHNIPHEIGNTCNYCQCSLDQHHSIDYVLDHKFVNKTSADDQKEMNDWLNRLCEASVDFAYFLTKLEISSEIDPFFLGLVQMIIEEKYLCDNQKPNDFNLQLVDYLRELQEEHDVRMKTIMNNQKERELSDIYQLINTIREYPMVREQMAAVKEGQKMIWKQYEVEVLENSEKAVIESTRL